MPVRRLLPQHAVRSRQAQQRWVPKQRRASEPAGPPGGCLAGITTQAFHATMRGAEWILGDRAFTSHNYGKHIENVHTQADYLACTAGDSGKALV